MRSSARSLLTQWTSRFIRTPPPYLSSCSRSASRLAALAAQDKPFYITTPIFYVNADPHIGHLYSMLVADIFKRWLTLRGKEVIMCTGVDEHGMKIQQAAAKAQMEPGPFCDQGAEQFKALARHANIEYDHFVRTTGEDHKATVEYAWHRLKEKDLIYTSKHEGWYSVSDETFYPEKDVELVLEPWSGRKMMASKETGKEVEWTEETNYHFRLSRFREQLLQFYEANPAWMLPRHRYQAIIDEVQAGCTDLSISRPSSRLTWGIPVPEDSSQTMYVWLDALLNYVTKAGYPWAPGEETKGGWPADVQIIGKDITRFHCIYWPAFLMALELPLPGVMYTHGHWLLGDKKMSKSVGNVVNPFFAIDRFGVDTIRYYLAAHGRMNVDTPYANELVIARYNKLKDSLGNLASRVLRGKRWSVPGIVRKFREVRPVRQEDREMWTRLENVRTETANRMNNLDISGAIETLIAAVAAANKYLHEAEPWTIAPKSPGDPVPMQLAETILLSTESLRIVGILLQPFIPQKAALLLNMLGVDESKRSYKYAIPGLDLDYGVSKVQLGRGHAGSLFPPIQEG